MDKRSEKTYRISASLVTAVAALVTLGGCGSQTGRCVDTSGRLLPDAACGGGGGGSVYVGGGSRSYSYPHYVYGGSVNGGRVVGYSTSPSFGSRVTSPSGTVVRGGFGHFGGGGGHGGGGE